MYNVAITTYVSHVPKSPCKFPRTCMRKARECIFSGAQDMAAMDAGKLIPLLYHPYTAISAIEGTYDGCTKTEKYAICGKRVILFKCRGQYIGGGKLLNRRNTLDIKRSDIHCYLFIFHTESWDQE